jgi:hypothetical protein
MSSADPEAARFALASGYLITAPSALRTELITAPAALPTINLSVSRLFLTQRVSSCRTITQQPVQQKQEPRRREHEKPVTSDVVAKQEPINDVEP